MKHKSLQDKTFSSVAWSGSIQILSQMLNFGLSIVLARLLAPEDFGLMATMLVFIGISQLLSDFGLSSSLIQKKYVAKTEAFSCAILNTLFGSTFTVALIIFHTEIAEFYNEPQLKNIVLVVAPIFILHSICSVPQALLSRELEHKKISLIGLVAMITGSISAVCLASAGFGVWALVLQQYISVSLKAFMLVYSSQLRISRFSLSSIKGLFSFSANVFLTRLIQQVAQQADKVLVGKYLGAQELGLYSRAFHFTAFPINNVTRVVSNVMFPALSKITGENEKVASVYLTVIGYIAIITFPTLAGFAYLSSEIILTLLGSQWLPMQPYLVFFSMIGIVSSIGQVSTPFFLSQGKANLHLKLNLFTQPCKTVFLLVGINWGIEGVLVANAAASFVSFTSSIFVLMLFVDVNIVKIFKALYKTIISTCSMILMLEVVNSNIVFSSSLHKLFWNVLAGASFYFLCNILIKNELFLNLYKLVSSKIVNK